MNKFIVIILLLMNLVPVFADTITTYRNPIRSNSFQSRLNMNRPKTQIIGYDKIKPRYHNIRRTGHRHNVYDYNLLPANKLDALEKYAFKKNFKRESDLERLERLESMAFGATQTGNIIERYNNAEQAILSRPQPNLSRSVLGNIANFLNGQPTGFTPNIENTFIPGLTPYGGAASYFPTPGFNNSRFEQYSNGIFGGGYGISNGSFGTGSSIKILD